MKKGVVVVVTVLLLTFFLKTSYGISNKQMISNVTQTLDFLLASNRYDKRLRPGFGGSPITISVNFFIKSMGPVSDNDQSFGIDCYFRQHWYDFRLQYQKLSGLEELSMSWLFLDRVWKPDTYFVNGKKSFLHRITVPNKFLRLRHDGYITYSMRLTISASCPMHLRKFPLDTQRCPLVLGSYGYTNKDVVYRWTDESPIGLQQGVEIAQFDLANVTIEQEKIMIKGGLSYSTVQANFWLKRHTGYFLLQVYIPCGLIVVSSWISFWIDPDAVPARVYVPCGLIVLSSWVSFWIDPDDVAARVALGVTTVLSLTTLGFGGRAQLPKVSYWTALDWFVIICFTSVFSVMIEYAIVNFIDKFTKDLTKIIQSSKNVELQKTEKQIQEMPKESFRGRELSSAIFKKDSVAEEKLKGGQTSAQIEKTLPTESKFSRKLSTGTTVTAERFSSSLSKKRSKSMPEVSSESENKTELPNSIMAAAEKNLIDFETDLDAIEVVLDVEEEVEGEKEAPLKEMQRQKLINFLKNLKPPKCIFRKMRILPREEDLIDQMESPEPPNKFSRIDVQSRRNFPIAFFLSLTVYLFAFSYYLTDDISTRDSALIPYKQLNR